MLYHVWLQQARSVMSNAHSTPGMLKEIRKQDRFKSLPIIALTAKAMKEDEQKCLNAGANVYLSKPVNLDELNLSLNQLL